MSAEAVPAGEHLWVVLLPAVVVAHWVLIRLVVARPLVLALAYHWVLNQLLMVAVVAWPLMVVVAHHWVLILLLVVGVAQSLVVEAQPLLVAVAP